MNIAIIFAGGTGQRMKTNGVPKQFLQLYGIPVIQYTLNIFEYHPEIDGIIVSCVKEWISKLYECINLNNFKKIWSIVEGGETGQKSIYNALVKASEMCNPDSIVLIHDGVRPLVSSETISRNIICVKANGNAITVTKSVETGVVSTDGKNIDAVLDRNVLYTAKAPQSFYLKDILEAHNKAIKVNYFDAIDSCSLMIKYGIKLNYVEGERCNIKITTPEDYYIFKALYDLQESEKVIGLK